MAITNIYDIIEPEDMNKNALLQILLSVQDADPRNYVSEENINQIAQMLNLSRSRVYSTASFYSEISLNPRGFHLIRVCTNAPCDNDGKAGILKAIEKTLGIRIGETTKDDMFTLESVNCLGACYMSPAIKIDDQVYGNLTPKETISILKSIMEADEHDKDE